MADSKAALLFLSSHQQEGPPLRACSCSRAAVARRSGRHTDKEEMKDEYDICKVPARSHLLQEELHLLCCDVNANPPGTRAWKAVNASRF